MNLYPSDANLSSLAQLPHSNWECWYCLGCWRLATISAASLNPTRPNYPINSAPIPLWGRGTCWYSSFVGLYGLCQLRFMCSLTVIAMNWPLRHSNWGDIDRVTVRDCKTAVQSWGQEFVTSSHQMLWNSTGIKLFLGGVGCIDGTQISTDCVDIWPGWKSLCYAMLVGWKRSPCHVMTDPMKQVVYIVPS